MRAAGNSLLETIIALFLLTSAAMVVVALYHTALQRTTRAHQGATARLLAQTALAEARAAATRPFSLLDPASLARTFQPPDHPGFEVNVRSSAASQANPCSSLLPGFPAAGHQTLNVSAANVEVEVTWNGGRESYRLNSLVEEGTAELAELLISGSSGPIAGSATATYTVLARDTDGNTMQDLGFLWWVEPGTGNASIAPNKGNQTAVLTNLTRGFDGVTFVQPGTCRVGVMARYRGKEVIGYSGDITLAP